MERLSRAGAASSWCRRPPGLAAVPSPGLCGPRAHPPPPPAFHHPLSHCDAMGFAHLRCNSITALIKIFISRPDCLLIYWKHMSGEVKILDSALLPKVQFNTGGGGEGVEGERGGKKRRALTHTH